MKIILYIISGLIIGFYIGYAIPYFMVKAAIEKSGDESAAGGMFLIFATIPLCSAFGAIFGGILGLIIEGLRLQKRPFSKKTVTKILENHFCKKELKAYYSGLKSGYDSGENTKAGNTFFDMGTFDGAKIKAYGSTEKVFAERISSLVS